MAINSNPHPSYKGYGRPVLIDLSQCSSENREKFMTGYLPDGRAAYIGIPYDGGYFGSRTYFHGEDKITTSCGLLEYDAPEGPYGLHYYGEHDHDKYHASAPEDDEKVCVMGMLAGCKGYWTNFIYADNDLLKCHLNSPKVGKLFKELALLLMDKLDR